jgi:hypothetical protein
MLENQVKYLTEGLTMCMNFINSLKNNQSIHNNAQTMPTFNNNNNNSFQFNPINNNNIINNDKKLIFGKLTYQSDT